MTLGLFLLLIGVVMAYTYTNNLQINTLPDDAKVYIDGELKGTTPILLTDLYDTNLNAVNSWEKRHWLQIYKDGWKSIHQYITTPAGSNATLNLDMQTDPQIRFVVLSDPAGARVCIRDHAECPGRTPITFNFSVPDYTNVYTWKLMLNLDGYYDSVTYHTMKAGETKVVSLMLNNRNSVGTLNVGTNPSGAKLYIDGVLKGVTPATIGRLSVGIHTIRLTREGYEPYQATFSITGQQVTKLTIDLVPK